MLDHPRRYTAIPVIKRNGKRVSEPYVHEKLHTSILAACLSVKSPEGEAETIAEKVSRTVTTWCNGKPSVTSQDLRRVASSHLEIFHPEAAYLYQNHELVV